MAGKRFSATEEPQHHLHHHRGTSGVRAKIAMFSSSSDHVAYLGGGHLATRYQSSEDVVGRPLAGSAASTVSLAAASMIRAHTQGDVRYEDSLRRKQLGETAAPARSTASLKSLNGSSSLHESSVDLLTIGETHKQQQQSLFASNTINGLRLQNKNTSAFRSMINVSSTAAASVIAPASARDSRPEDKKAASVSDLTKESNGGLMRSTQQHHGVIWEETGGTQLADKSPPVSSSGNDGTPKISSRSQSLNEIGVGVVATMLPNRPPPEATSLGRSRSSTLLLSGSSGHQDGAAKGVGAAAAGASVLEQRRRSTMSKLKGLVIPEAREDSAPNSGGGLADGGGPERWRSSDKEDSDLAGSENTNPQLSHPPWKDKSDVSSEDFPKYSPAFKRKPFTVYNTSAAATVSVTNKSVESHSNKPPIGKRFSDEGSAQLVQAAAGKHEDSDNDSAVSSGRSSLSGRSSSPPPTAAARRESVITSSNNNTAGGGAAAIVKARRQLQQQQQQTQPPQQHLKDSSGNPRILKKNSVEAINRQNVINACKKRSATLNNSDVSGSPASEEGTATRTSSAFSRPASRSSSFNQVAERKRSFETTPSSTETTAASHVEGSTGSVRRGSSSSAQDPLSRRSSRDGTDALIGSSSRRFSQEAAIDNGSSSSRRGSRAAPSTTTAAGSTHHQNHAVGGNHSRSSVNSSVNSSFTTPPTTGYPGAIAAIEEKVAYMTDVVDRAASVTPTERRSVSRTNSYSSSRSSRNSSIVSEKAVALSRTSVSSANNSVHKETNSSVLQNSGQDAASVTASATASTSQNGEAGSKKNSAVATGGVDKWSELERKYSKNSAQQMQLQQHAESIGDKISRLKGKTVNEEAGASSSSSTMAVGGKTVGGGISERPKDLALAKKLSNGALISSPGTVKNFKELAEKWQTIAVETPTTPVVGGGGFSAATLPRKSSKEKSPSPAVTPTARDTASSTMPRRSRYIQIHC